jgi:hypothetical protein
MSLELLVPQRTSAHPTDFSQIEIRADGRKVLDIRSGSFRAALYEPGVARAGWMCTHPVPINLADLLATRRNGTAGDWEHLTGSRGTSQGVGAFQRS